MSGEARARLIQELAARYGVEILPGEPEDRIVLRAQAASLRPVVADLRGRRCSLLSLFAVPGSDGSPCIHYLFDREPDRSLIVLRHDLAAGEPLTSIAGEHLGAADMERRLSRKLDLELRGHPDPHPSVRVEGIGVRDETLGPGAPVPASAGELRLQAFGERVIHLERRPQVMRRPAPSWSGNTPVSHLAVRLERACGRCGVANVSAGALAIEQLAGVELPPRARALRTMALELSRLVSHTGTLASILGLGGFDFLEAQVGRALEALRLGLEHHLGSRMLFGCVLPGGFRPDPGATDITQLRRLARAMERILRQAMDQAMEDPVFVSRLTGAGLVPTALVRELDLTGPMARASGSRRDVRRDHPFLQYPELTFWVPIYVQGDALARVRVISEEAQQSAALCADLLDSLPAGPCHVPLGALARSAVGLGMVEGPRGAVLVALRTDAEGRIDAVHLHPAEHIGGVVPELVLPGVGLEELPIVSRTFDLCAACASA